MKKSCVLSVLAIFALFVAIPSISNAQTLLETETAVGIGASLDSSSTITPAAIREKLRTDSRLQNTKNNVKDVDDDGREDLIKNRAATLRANSTSSAVRMNASSSTSVKARMAEGAGDDRGQKIMDRIRKDIFEKQKNHLVRELNRSLTNLTQVRERIVVRIEKAEENGRVMTNAKSALVIADQKLALARTAVLTLASSTVNMASSTDNTASSSALVDITKHRQAGAAAIKAVNEAKKALNSVVVAIARSMGLKVGVDGKIEATITASTTPQVN